jgi:hypothetical protein
MAQHTFLSWTKQARCDLSLLAPIAERWLSPILGVVRRAFGNFIVRFDHHIPYERKQALAQLWQSSCQCTDLPFNSIPVPFGSRKEPLLQRDRFLDKLLAVVVVAAKPMSQSKTHI